MTRRTLKKFERWAKRPGVDNQYQPIGENMFNPAKSMGRPGESLNILPSYSTGSE